jgi:hypothetical protein
MLGGSVEAWTKKSILFQLIEDKIHFGIPKDALMNLVLNEQN